MGWENGVGGRAEAWRRCEHKPTQARDISQNKGHELQAGRLPGTKTQTDSPRHILLSTPKTLGTRRSHKLPGRKHRSGSKDRVSEWLQTSRKEYWTPGDDEENLQILKENDFQPRLLNSRQGQGRT